MAKRLRFSVLFLLVLFISGLNAQIKIKELPVNNFESIKSDYISNAQSRKTTLLNSGWQIFLPEGEEPKATVTVPSSFLGSDELIFKKKLSFTQQEIDSRHFRLFFLGLNYSAEVYVNHQVLYKSPAASIPAIVDIPRDILTPGSENILSVKINNQLDSEATIPLKQTFHAPLNTGGIFREVYLQSVPDISIAKNKFQTSIEKDLSSGGVNVKIQLNNSLSSEDNSTYKLSLQLVDPSGLAVASAENLSARFNNKEEVLVEHSLKVEAPKLWSPDAPIKYTLRVKLFNNSKMIDESFSYVIFYSLEAQKNGLKLNNVPFAFKGVSYFPTLKEKGSLISYERLKNDLQQIKNTGFNTVRFTKLVPHISAFDICRDIGLFVITEIPVNSVPLEIAAHSNFRERIERYINYFTETFQNGYSIAAIGAGSSYLVNEPVHNDVISTITKTIKKNSNKLSFASFAGFPTKEISNLDLYGIELFNKPVNSVKTEINQSFATLGKGRVFISEATYSTFRGSTNGYKNINSFEGQAKYYEDIIKFSKNNKSAGFIVNTMYDYRGEFAPFSTGYNSDNVIATGIIGEDRTTHKLAYKVIRANLNKEEKITIPMGHKKDDAPIFFILVGLGLAIMLAILFNSKRKFREEASRALIRPYNFYADIRDQRILSGFHSNILMFILTSSMSLLICNVLFFLRTNVLFERVLLSFGNKTLISVASYLAWDPVNAFVYIFAASMLLIGLLSLMIRAASFFVKTKVLLSSVYYTVTWSFLPFALILPLNLILYRVLSTNVANIYIYAFLIVFALWLVQRILKGIYVIFDVRAAQVYLYSFIFILFTLGGLLLYYQLSESTFYYIINAYKLFALM